MRNLIYIFIALLFLLVTFFGLGPVLFADGSSTERLLTLLVVVFIYLILVLILVYLHRNKTKKL